MKILKSSLYKKYVFSYLIVFSIPLFIFLLLVNSFYVRSLEEELQTTNANFLEQASFQLDEQILEMNTVANQIKYSDELSRYLLNVEANSDKLTEVLKSYEYSMRSTKSLYILLTDRNTVLSSDGIMSTEALLNKSTDFNVEEKEQLIDALSSSEEKLAIHTLDRFYKENQVRKKNIYYMIPLRQSNVNNGMLVFVLNTNQIQTNLETMRETEKELSFLVDEKGRLVASKGLSQDFSESDLEKIQESMIKNGKAKINNQAYVASSKVNPLTGWTFVSLIETTRFYFPLLRLLATFLLWVIILGSIGIGVSVYFANKHYRPIKNLASVFRLEGDKIGDELAFLKTNINKTKAEYIKLNQLMNEHAPIVRNSALLNLVEGKYLNNAEFFQHLEDVGLNFPYAIYAVMIVEFEKETNVPEKIIKVEAIVQEITKSHPELKGIWIEATVPYLVNNQIIVVINMDKESKCNWQKTLKYIQTIIKREDFDQALAWKIAIGTAYDKIDKIKNSYIEASSALEKMKSDTYTSSPVLFFTELTQRAEIVQEDAPFQYPREEIMLLVQSVKQGNKEAAFEIVLQLKQKIKNDIHHSIAKQAVIADMFNRVLKIANEFNMYYQYEKIYQLTDFKDINLAQPVLEDIISSICDNLDHEKDTQNTEMKRTVVDYIYSHYDSPAISLGEIAAEQNISVSYASRLVKEETGESFSHLIQSLRMEQFKTLLVETKRPIKELITEVGYYDASNFTRKFRLENGLTPSQYRFKYQDSDK
ncbi:HTH-type transcriptional regulator YesS [Jeotgalibaca dankookensis]|uniref:HTH-type transcriptional regulator YesS n=1 Tax=Jeotgalibaca dankookensis TaxID=708126 RepID=A0A1S6IR15_9LACT|nr:helix-turn-helix domain-containing protein [Jeotgalibaca dankookensis]AQS53993.1 HTH-type transcriptional regulator YesS [Jeotgalibaca dankookensis]